MQPPLPVSLLFHLGGFFVAALFCHGLLAEDRPSPAYLTDFYLWLAVGGVLGGTFNTLLAPLVFKTALEYPLILALICLVRIDDPQLKANRRLGWRDVLPPLGIAGLTAALILGLSGQTDWPVQLRDGDFTRPARVGLLFSRRSPVGIRFRADGGAAGQPIVRRRTGATAVHHTNLFRRPARDRRSRRTLSSAGAWPNDPRSPKSRSQAAANAAVVLRSARPGRTDHGDRSTATTPQCAVGVIGLGAGDLAGYAQPGEDWTFYEIDPAVAEIATNPAFFTFLSDCPASYRIHIGDGRLRLQETPDAAYDVFFLDAFSSDAIPTRLLTREAIQGYLRTLSDDGLLVLHVSNRYLDLKPVVANLAADAGLVAAVSTHVSSVARRNRRRHGPCRVDRSECAARRRLGVLAKRPSGIDLLRNRVSPPGPTIRPTFSTR